MRFNKITEKIQFCIGDISEFVDLIEINDTTNDLLYRYELCSKISGQKIENRIENLIIACWSAKDWMKKDLMEIHNGSIEKEFENKLLENSCAQLIQYLANAFKHGGVNESYNKKNKFKDIHPSLGKTFLRLINNSFPHRFKPCFQLVGDAIPPFKIENVMATINGEKHFNFDTVIISMQILDKNGVEINHAMNVVSEYIETITILYANYKSNKFRN